MTDYLCVQTTRHQNQQKSMTTDCSLVGYLHPRRPFSIELKEFRPKEKCNINVLDTPPHLEK